MMWAFFSFMCGGFVLGQAITVQYIDKRERAVLFILAGLNFLWGFILIGVS